LLRFYQDLPLSNNTVQRRIDDMAHDVEEKLHTRLRENKFSLQLDESTLRHSEALLLTFVRFGSAEGAKEEFLFASKS
jgi:hypothetical protein